MKQNIVWIVVALFLLVLAGCGGGGGNEKPEGINTNPPPKPAPTPEPKGPTAQELWLSEKCGACHDSAVLPGLFQKALTFSAEEFEAKLNGMTQDGKTIAAEDIAEVMKSFRELKGAPPAEP